MKSQKEFCVILRKGFARASRDPHIVELAEWGMDDYEPQLREIIKGLDEVLKY